MGILKTKKQIISALSIITLVIIGCEGFEPLPFQRENYIGNNLKTDGYYYFFSNKNDETNDGTKYYEAFMLFRNGVYVLVTSGSYSIKLDSISRLKQVDKDVKNRVDKQNNFINLNPNWGIFKINGQSIQIKRWLSGNGQDYPIQTLKGTIINDSTINIFQKIGDESSSKNSKKKTYIVDETYHFRQFSPKPDSTNKFIK